MLLVWLLWWVYRSKRQERLVRESTVATGNHPSLRKFHYGPVPFPGPLVAAPPLAPDSLLNQLLPEEDFKAWEAREEAKDLAEAARVEAEQMAERESAQVPAPVAVTAVTAAEKSAPALAEKLASVPAGVPIAEPTDTPPPALADGPVPVLLSSRHAPDATVNVFDVLALVGNDAPAPTPAEAAVAASPGAAPQPVVATATPDGELAGEAIYDNPVSPTTAAQTKNDAANTQAAVMLRQRNRAALQARLDTQKTAMAAFTTDTKQAR